MILNRQIYRTLLRICFSLMLIQMVPLAAEAQQERFKIQGRVMDASTGDPLPFVNVYLKNTSIGSTTDFQGYYLFETSELSDSLVASYIGYIPSSKLLSVSTRQTINFQRKEDVVHLNEVIFYADENPAYEIMRNVISNKKNTPIFPMYICK